MPTVDATTLLLVNALFSAVAGLVWAALALVFRIAPLASGLLAAAHLLTVPALLGSWCLEPLRPQMLSQGLTRVAGVLVLALTALALRRLLRLRWRRWDLLALAAAGLLLSAWGGGDSGPGQGRSLASLSMAALAALALHDLRVGRGGLPPGLAWILGLPLGGLLLANLLRAAGWSATSCATSTPLAWAWLVLGLSLTLGLLVLVLHRLVVRVEQLTLSDPLTGVLNRRGLAVQQARLQAQAERGRPYALLLIDLDHFKRINDQLGHAAGDAALQHVVQQLRAGLRGLDQLARLGGEEFCVLLPETRLVEAAAVAERLRTGLKTRPFVWLGQELLLSASFGVAASEVSGPVAESLLAQADAALYRAKDQGRDRISLAGAPLPEAGA